MVLYMCKLLTYARESRSSKDMELAYVMGITKALNACHHWTQPFKESMETLSLRKVKERVYEEKIPGLNVAKLWDASGEITENADDAMVIDISYPFMDSKSLSTQALSIMTFCKLCEAFHQIQSQDIREILRVPILQIVEGLQDSKRRQDFHRLADSQVKSRLSSWKKSKDQKRRAVLRRLIDEEHHAFLRSQILLLDDPALQNVVLQSLQLTEQHTPTNVKNKKHQAIYCI